MALDDTKNFCKVTVSTGYTSTDTSINLVSGDGAKLPTPPFNLVWYNETDYPDVQSDPNKEIVRVTAISGDILTIMRGQEGTTAVDHNLSGKTYKMINAITKKMIDDINNHITDTSNPHSVTANQVGAITKVEDDTNPKLGGDLDLQTHKIVGEGGANGIYVDANGNVGIGTTNPNYKLDVTDEIALLHYINLKDGGTIRNTINTDKIGLWGGTSYRFGPYVEFWPENSAIPGRLLFTYGSHNTHLPGAFFRLNFGSPSSGVTGVIYADSGGNVGINTTSPSYKLDVSGDIHCTGKVTSGGGNDPPYVLYNYETRDSIVKRIKKEISPSKLNGAVLFFNGEKQSLELFLPSKGEFRSLEGKLLEKVKPVTKTFETEKRYYFDEETGMVKHYEAKKKIKKYRLKQNVFVDPLTGKFKKKIKNQKEETEKEMEISEEEAIERTGEAENGQSRQDNNKQSKD